MMFYLLLLVALVIGIAAGVALKSGQGAYLVDVVLAVAMLPFLRPGAILAILGVQFAARRVPYLARSCVNTFGVHWRLVPVLFPGAVEVETIDTLPPPPPAYDVKITSSARTQARETFQQQLRGQRIRDEQAKQRAITSGISTGQPGPSTGLPTGQPPVPATIRLDSDEARDIARLLAEGKTVSQIAQTLPGFHPRKRQQFKAKVEAVKATIKRS